MWQPPDIILVNINGRNKHALMYVASTYQSSDPLNWQFEREEDKLINFNFNELHCPVFIICLLCWRFLFVFVVRKQKYPETTYRWYFAVIQFKLWTTWRRILAAFNGKLFSLNLDLKCSVGLCVVYFSFASC